MNRFREEIGIIRWQGWAIAGCVYVLMAVIMKLGPLRSDPSMRLWEPWLQALFIVGVGLPCAAYALLVSYIYWDAKRREMRYVLWTFLAALIPNAIGIILYFVLRDALRVPCSHCGAALRPGFAFCPVCGALLSDCCPKCGCVVESGWSHCARCGAGLHASV